MKWRMGEKQSLRSKRTALCSVGLLQAKMGVVRDVVLVRCFYSD